MEDFDRIVNLLPSERDSDKKIKYFENLRILARPDDLAFWKLFKACENILIGFSTNEVKDVCFRCLTEWTKVRVLDNSFTSVKSKNKWFSDKLWDFFKEKLRNLSRIEFIPIQVSILEFLHGIMFYAPPKKMTKLKCEKEVIVTRAEYQERTKILREDTRKHLFDLFKTLLKTTERRVVYRRMCLYSLSIMSLISMDEILTSVPETVFFFNCLKFVLSSDPLFFRTLKLYDNTALFSLVNRVLFTAPITEKKKKRKKKKKNLEFFKKIEHLSEIDKSEKERMLNLSRECLLLTMLRSCEVRQKNTDLLLAHKNALFQSLWCQVFEPSKSVILNFPLAKSKEKLHFFSCDVFQPHFRNKTSSDGEALGKVEQWKNSFSRVTDMLIPTIEETTNLDDVVKYLIFTNHQFQDKVTWNSYYAQNSDTLSKLLFNPSNIDQIFAILMKIMELNDDGYKIVTSCRYAFRSLVLTTSEDPSKNIRKRIFELLADDLRSSMFEFRKFSKTDIKIFKTPPTSVFWDLKKELLLSPHLDFGGSSSSKNKKNKNKKKDTRKKNSLYSLNSEQWKDITGKVQKLKKTSRKEVKMDDIRLECMEEVYKKKEGEIRERVGKVHERMMFLLDILICLCEEPMNEYFRKKRFRMRNSGEIKQKTSEFIVSGRLFSDVICEHSHYFIQLVFSYFKLSEELGDLSWKAFCVFRNLLTLTYSQNTRIPPSRNAFIARCVAHATYRMTSVWNIKNDRSVKQVKSNNTIRFASRVVKELRKYLKSAGQMLTPQSFAATLPFLQNMIHHKNLPRRRRKSSGKKSVTQYQESTFRIALNFLCSHAGHPKIESKDILTEILMEVIVHIPRLREQAESTLHEVAKLFLPPDLTPILNADSLFSPYSDIRRSLMNSLACYPPLNSQKNDGLFVQRKNMYFPSHKNLVATLWMARFDRDEELAGIGNKLWDSYWRKIGQDETKDEDEEEMEGEGEDDVKKVVKEEEEKEKPKLCEKIEDEIFKFLRSKNDFLRHVTCRSLAEAVIQLSPTQRISPLVKRLIDSFSGFGQTGRFSVMATLRFLMEHFGVEDISMFYDKFILNIGLTDKVEAIKNEVVQLALDALKLHAKQHKTLVTDIFDKFLKKKQSESKKKLSRKKSEDEDFVVGNVSTFLGFVAQYHEDDDKIREVMNQLIETLKIPSNRVQKSSMEALSSLVATLCRKSNSSELPKHVDSLLTMFLEKMNEGDYGVRRGRVFGITGVVKGAGIKVLKKYQIMKKLHEMSFANSSQSRETAMIAYELFSSNLVPYFEAYLAHIIPPILFGLEDLQPENVLGQAERALKEVMSTGMSEFSVRLITPKVLEPLGNEKTFWRVKVGCCRLIGYMASVAPRQLDVTLPIVVNALMGSLSDVKTEVSDAAFAALKRLGSVVKNRNLLGLLPDLLESLNNPTFANMRNALRGILRTKFTHTLDAAAITLLVPVLVRGMVDSDVNINLLSAKIVGMICGYLVKNFRILIPYVPKLLEGLRKKLIGANPDVRGAAAKAIGRISKVIFSIDMEQREAMHVNQKFLENVKKSEEEDEETEDEEELLGEDGEIEKEEKKPKEIEVEDTSLVRNLMGATLDFINNIMDSVSMGNIEREGAAMAVSEIAASQGGKYIMKELTSRWIPMSNHDEGNIREGYMKIFTYLPILIRDEFEPYLKTCLTRTLGGLSDSDDSVRETCYRGSSVMIRYFGIEFVELILPILLVGLQNDDWMTRLNCLKLLSNLLHNITVEEAIRKEREEDKKKEEAGEEETEGENEEVLRSKFYEEAVFDIQSLENILTTQVTHEILATLFLIQCDEHQTVKSKALYLWRSAIEKRQETILSDILPTLLNIIIEHLSGEMSMSDSRRRIAARACNVLVEKMGGSKIVGKLVPILSDRISDPKKQTRVGVCVGISEIMKSSTTGTLRKYSKLLLKVVKVGICDGEREVQVAASQAFNELSKVVGEKEVVNYIVKVLIKDLLSEEINYEKQEEEEIGEENEQNEAKDKKYNYLSGLSQLVKINPRIVLPVLIPSLLVEHMQDIHLNALGRIAKQSGHLFVDYYQQILTILLKHIHKRKMIDATDIGNFYETKDPLFFAISRFCQTCLVNKDALKILIEYLDQCLMQSLRSKRVVTPTSPTFDTTTARFPVIPSSVFLQVLMLCYNQFDESQNTHFFQKKGRKFSKKPIFDRENMFKFSTANKFIGSLMHFMNSDVEEVVRCCSISLKMIFERLLNKDEKILMIPTLRDHLQKYHQKLTEPANTKKPGFPPPKKTKKKSIAVVRHLECFKLDVMNMTLVKLFEAGVMGKVAEPKEAAIYCLRYFIEMTPPKILEKYVAKVAGRLVRIGGAKLRWQIKIVILETLVTLINLGGRRIMAYTSQLQTIFVKSLQSPTQIIRDQAAKALGMLVDLGKAKVKKLVIELHSAIKRFKPHNLAYDLNTCSVCVGVMKGLEIVLIKQGDKVQETVMKEIITTLMEKIFEEERITNKDILRWGSNVAGACMKRMSSFDIKEEVILSKKKITTQILMVRGAFKHCAEKLSQDYVLDLIVKVSECTVSDVNDQMQVQAVQLFLPYIIHFTPDNQPIDSKVMTSISNCCSSKQNVVRYHAFELVMNFAKKLREISNFTEELQTRMLYPFVEMAVKGAKDKHTPTKLVAEKALSFLLGVTKVSFGAMKDYIEIMYDMLAEEESEEKKKVMQKLCKKVQKRMLQQDGLMREEEEEEEF